MRNQQKTGTGGAIASETRPGRQPNWSRVRRLSSYALILASIAGMSTGCAGMSEEQWEVFRQGYRIGTDLANRFSDASDAEVEVPGVGKKVDATEDSGVVCL